MLLSYSEMLEANSVIVEIKSKEIPARLALKFVRIARIFDEHISDFNKVRQSIIEKYCEKDDDGNPVIANDSYKIDDYESFTDEVSQLLSEEVEVDVKKLKDSDLELMPTISIESMLKLAPIMV